MRYRELYGRNQPARDAEEMASLAERLGHRFEAILYLTAAVAEDPDRADLRGHLHRLGASCASRAGRTGGYSTSSPRIESATPADRGRIRASSVPWRRDEVRHGYRDFAFAFDFAAGAEFGIFPPVSVRLAS